MSEDIFFIAFISGAVCFAFGAVLGALLMEWLLLSKEIT